jgi:preprotein translocase subunit SecG
MLYYLIAGLYLVICVALMLVILLQQGKGGDIANAFGGGGSQAAFGARAGATVLSRATALFAVLFIVGAVVLGIVGTRGGGGASVVGGRNPLQQPSTPVAPPAPSGPVNTQSPATPAPAPAAPSTPPPAATTTTPAPAAPAPGR